MIQHVEQQKNIEQSGRSVVKTSRPVTNARIADSFDEIARLLESQLANPFRVRAYRQGATMLRSLDQPVDRLYREEGLPGLEKLPDIGRSLSRAIAQQVTNGHIPLLDQLHGEDSPERRFASIPGIGPDLAARIHETLDIDTLGELLAAAIDGRLSDVSGFGPRRVQAVRDSLDARRAAQPESQPHQPGSPSEQQQTQFQSLHVGHPDDEPSVDELLDIDAEYRHEADLGRLKTIAPQRFNPTGEAWLPILHTTRGDRHYHAMFSNTARAHELGTTPDWVVISRDDDGHHGQWTVITSQFGRLKGKRIVRGREDECTALYQQDESKSDMVSASQPESSDVRSGGSANDRSLSGDRPHRRQLSLFPQLASTVRS